MKNLVFILSLIASIGFSQASFAQIAMVANTENAEIVENKTIVEVAIANKDFSTLVAALKAADLVEALQGEGPFTVFAPSNDAFAKIDAETLSSLLEEKNKKALATILTYHVIPGKLVASDVAAALKEAKGTIELTTLNGQLITIMTTNGKIWLKDQDNNYSKLIATDVMASNGVIHVVNAVAMPN